MARITRWLMGASRNEFPAAEDRTKTAFHEDRNEAKMAENSVQTGHPAMVAQVSQEATVAACEDAVPGAEIDGQEPLIKITTEAGTIYFMRREAWQMAKENGARDVFLCQWNGEPIGSDGSKKTLRVSTLRDCKLIPMALPTIDGWLRPEQNSEPHLGL